MMAKRRMITPSRLRMLSIRIFPSVLSGARPIVSPSLFSQSWAMKIAPSLRLDSAARLILLRQLDPLRKWESLDDRRFCRCCHKFISGRQIEVTSASGKPLRLICPTTDCSSTVRDWVYPNEIAQPPDAWGRRVLRVVDKSGESFIACEKPYTRRRTSGSTTGQSRVNVRRSINF
jgi:hypothetical protein